MDDKPTPAFDPERLKRERHDVDFGTDRETGYDHVANEPEVGTEKAGVLKTTTSPVPSPD